MLLLIVPIVGTVYPEPAYPCNYFAYIFGAYVLLGAILVFVRSRSKAEIDSIRKVLDEKTMASSSPKSAVAAVFEADGPAPAVA